MLLVNGKPFYVCGGEIQYFRLPKSEWRNRLKLAKTGGINTVSSYMPWYWHEPEEGMIDFYGKTKLERNLKYFLELTVELDLKVIARPGPFVNSELRCGGIPEWLFRNHPETMSCKSDGNKSSGRPVPAEGEPLYREYVRKWYSCIVPLIAEFDINKGGSVILFQPDNELSAAWSYGLLNSLYDPAIINHFWPEWLKMTYCNISVLNEIYKRKYKTFKNVKVPHTFLNTNSEKMRCFDWMNFKRWFFADWGTQLAKWAVEYGIKVPIIFNEPVAGFYEHGDHAGFGAILKQNDVEGTTSCHTYSDRILDLEGVVTPSIGVELVKSSPWGGPPLSLEVNTNWYLPRLSRSEINWEPLMRLGFAHGLMGSVIYPYTAGIVDSEDVIINGPEYFNPSCISVDGKMSAGYYYIRKFYRFIQSWEEEISYSDTVADITIAYTPGQRLMDFLGTPQFDTNVGDSTVPGKNNFGAEPSLEKSNDLAGHDWIDGYEGVSKQTIPPEAGLWKKIKETALLFTRMNVSFDFLDITNPNKVPGHKWLIIPCTGCLEKKAVDYLLSHIDNGGGCLFFPTIPVSNLDGKKDLRLSKRLGVRLINQIRPAGGQLIDYGARIIGFGEGEKLGTYNWIYEHKFPSKSTILAKYQNIPIAAKMPDNSGKIIISGIDACFTTFSSLAFWKMVICEAMELEPVVTSKDNYCYALLRKGNSTSILTVMNITGIIGKSNIIIQNPFRNGDKLMLNLELSPHEARCLLINADYKGKRILYATSEVIPQNKEYFCLELYGASGTKGEISFAKPTKVRLNGKIVHTEPTNGHYVISYIHTEKPLILSCF